ncbi:ornithine carbamoyltransferase [Kitasatospora sp. NPDC002551]|uniref:ornithine carbamoyltransferase n=1 Tax=unclassified Kitasatospora TaxID=2633591 RepID=UPI003317D1DF
MESRHPHRSLLSTDDLTDRELRAVVDRGAAFAAGCAGEPRPLAGDVVGVYFRMTSTRTRTAFSSAALRLGAQIIAYGPDDLQTNTGESLDDTGKVLGRMLDVVVARTGSPQRELAAWADPRRLSVVNAMTEEEHPTQALTDLTTLKGRFGEIDGLRVVYVGEGNNTAAALALALPRFPGTLLELRTPPGYGLTEEVRARAEEHARRSGASFVERHDMDALPADADAVYTTRWQTTGTNKPDPEWREVFAPFQVTRDLWEDSPKAVFMHDLPAHRGEEVTAEVLDGPTSIAFAQAENKMHSAMAVLEWCRGGGAAA